VLMNSLAARLSKSVTFSEKVIITQCRPGFKSCDLFSAIGDLIRKKAGDRIFGNQEPGPDNISSLIDERGMVLMLEDLHLVENDSVLQLLSSASFFEKGRLIVSSRHKPGFEAPSSGRVHLHTLSGLNRDEASSLIAMVASQYGKPPAADEQNELIYNLTTGHPFSLKLMASLLLSGRISEKSLKTGGGEFREHIHRYLISTVWDTMPEKARHLLRRLALLRIPVTRELIINRFQDPDSTSCRTLSEWCLLEENDSGKIWIHDLVKTFVQAMMNHDDKIAFSLELAQILIKAAGADMDLAVESHFQFLSAGDQEGAAVALSLITDINLFIRIPSRNLLPLLKNALSGSGLRNPDLDFACTMVLFDNHMPEEAGKRLLLLTDWHRNFVMAEQARNSGRMEEASELFLKAQENCADPAVRLLIRLKLAMMKDATGSREECDNLLASVKSEISSGDFPLVAPLYYHYQTFIHMQRGDFDQVLETSSRAEELYRAINAQGRLSEVFLYRGGNLVAAGRINEAEPVIRLALSISTALNLNSIRIECLNMLAWILFKKDDFRQTVILLEQSLKLQSWGVTGPSLVKGCGFLGFVHTRLDELDLAEKCFRRMLEYSADVDDLITAGQTFCYYLPFLMISGRFDEASTQVAQIASQISDFPQYRDEALYLINLFNALPSVQAVVVDFHGIEPVKSHSELEIEYSWLKERISQQALQITVFENCRQRLVHENDLKSLLISSEKYDLLADFRNREIRVRGKPVDIARKKVLLHLLQVLCIQPLRLKAASEVYREVWDRVFDPGKDMATFRSNISRLRKTLDKDNPYRFIVNDGHLHGLNPQTTHLIIPCSTGAARIS
ncbi:MAG: hypothetical protein PHQ23_07575, partial [Candidatus Wallbacteria bacterium]|nr:hypothetical protein [Candidatus Wallbacteria bacterium]